MPIAEPAAAVHVTEHRGGDDLLTAGLGDAGLRGAAEPFADPGAPTAAELRRRAIWANWRGIADLSPLGGYGAAYGATTPVPGREYHALLRLPGAHAPHRVLVQVPDGFDARRRCVLLTASSGSRGAYGAISVAGAWGLPRGCAVVYTDKGCGTDWVELGSGEGHALDGRATRDAAAMAFSPHGDPASHAVAFKHAHAQDNPEADWGRHLRQAAEFALQVLNDARPDAAPFDFANTCFVAAGVSNGGGAVLRAAEFDGDWLRAAIAIAPNVYPGDGGRPLFDYATEAALLMGAAQLAPELADAPAPLAPALLAAQREAACASLQHSGLLPARDPAQAARAQLHAGGWTDAALRAGVLSTAFELWRACAAAYASAYARSTADAMPCGYRYAVCGADGLPRAATRAERAAWWSDSAGIPPGAGVQLLDTLAAASGDPLAGVQRLRTLWDGDDALARRVQAGVAATRAALPRAGLPLLVVHGTDDGLIPAAFSSAPYVDWVRRAGRAVTYWRAHGVQHFDSFLGLPAIGERYPPLLAYAYAALDAAWAHLFDGAAWPADREFRPRRAQGRAVQRGDLDLA